MMQRLRSWPMWLLLTVHLQRKLVLNNHLHLFLLRCQQRAASQPHMDIKHLQALEIPVAAYLLTAQDMQTLLLASHTIALLANHTIAKLIIPLLTNHHTMKVHILIYRFTDTSIGNQTMTRESRRPTQGDSNTTSTNLFYGAFELGDAINSHNFKLPWPPNSLNLNLSTAETAVPPLLYNFLASTCGLIDNSAPLSSLDLNSLTPSDHSKLHFISYNIVVLKKSLYFWRHTDEIKFYHVLSCLS